jgi:hypothetical protein
LPKISAVRDFPKANNSIAASALESDPELLAFWQELSRRDDLQLLFR